MRAFRLLLALATLAAAGRAAAQEGAIVVQTPSFDAVAPFTAAQQATDFVVLPSVLSSTYSVYGTGVQTVPISIACILLPDGVIVPNCDITLQWSALAGTGGHVHNTQRPPGKFTTANGATGGSTSPAPPGSVTDNSGASGVLDVTYGAPEASGVTSVTASGVAVVNGVRLSFGPATFTIGVLFGGLGAVSGTGLAVSTQSNNHDSNNGNGNPGLASALADMSARFAAILQAQRAAVPTVRVTAISLPEGGLFDFQTQWAPPHRSHRFGNDADVGIRELTRRQRAALAAAIRLAGLTTPVPSEAPSDPAATHWHLRLP
ncbi:MAG TPA: hypothetical protein VIV57_19535 [Anaeromyxobacter sp.]